MSNQIVKKSIKEVLALETVQERFGELLRQNARAYMSSILTAVANNPALAECEPMSIVSSAIQLATLGLSLSPALGHAALVPFNSRDGKKATPIIMKKGLVELALRTGQYRLIHVAKIYQGEMWVENRLTGEMTLEGNRTGREVVGYVAYFKLLSGFEKYLAMSTEDIVAHAKKFSKAWDGTRFRPGSGWSDNFERMCEKTPLRLLLMQYGPMSFDVEKALASDDGEAVEEEFIDGDVPVEEDAPAPAPAKSAQQLTAELGFGF
jgi:recombination protein RecT